MSGRTVSSPYKPSTPSPDPRFSFSSPVPSIGDSSLPPTKKRRFTSSASSSSFSVPTPRSSSSSHIEPVYDLHRARRASSLRVLDIWSSLAARYNRRLDEDDIVDICTGDVIKDRGVLRELPQQFEIGHFADADDPLNPNYASSEGDGAQTEAEDDVDEIDAFASENDITKELRLESRAVPPVQVMDPADAYDLREFMEAERLRRELDGEEDSEDDFDVPASLELSSIYDSSDPPENDDDRTSDQHDTLRSSEDPVDADDSEDELAAWGVDEGNTIYQVLSEPALDIEDNPSPLPSPQLAPVSLQPSSTPPTVTKPPMKVNRAYVSPKQKAPSPKRERRIRSTLSVQLYTPPPSLLDSSLDDIDVQFPPPRIRLNSKFKPPPSSPGNLVMHASESMSPRNEIISDKMTTPTRELVPTVVLPQTSIRNIQGNPTRSSFNRPCNQETKDAAVSQRIHDSTKREDGPSAPQNNVRLAKSRRKSIGCETRNKPDPSLRKRKRKRTISSSEDTSIDKHEKSQINDRDATTDSDSDIARGPRSEIRTKHRSRSTRPQHSTSNSYPYYSPHTPQHERQSQYPPPIYQPIQDPNAQFIIAHAMQQLAYLVTGPQPSVNGSMGWSPLPGQSISGSGYPPFPLSHHQQPWPFTPTHHQHPDADSTTSSTTRSSLTSSTPSHYPYPGFTPSQVTSPPSSPEQSSSPVKAKNKRSKSRRVSFNLTSSGSPRTSSEVRRKSTSRKGKGKALSQDLSNDEEEESGDDGDQSHIVSSPIPKSAMKKDRNGCRKMVVGRGKTPGPPVARDKMGR